MTARQAHGRIQRVVTGQQARGGAVDAHERNVLAITRRIHKLERERRTLRARLDALTKDLRFARRELRATLQRDATMTADEGDALALAGKADAVDAAEARRAR